MESSFLPNKLLGEDKYMNPDKMIKWTNRIALLSITLLIYWVFIYISITVFDFKVFRENITETFYLSVLAILALMFGAIVVNVMFNLTKIASSVGKQNQTVEGAKKAGKSMLVFLVSFPLIFGLLYLGDKRSTQKKENRITASAQALVKENKMIMSQFAEYEFDDSWRRSAGYNIRLLKKIDESFPNVLLIVADEIQGKSVFLAFSDYYKDDKEKADFIYSCSPEERAYLSDVFNGNLTKRFSSSDKRYELYYPVKIGEKIMVLYLSERQRYGKIGS